MCGEEGCSGLAMGRVRALRPSSAVHLAHLPCPPTTISTSSPPRHVCSRFAVGSRRLARGKLGSGLHCAAKFGRRLGAGASFQAAASVLLLRRARDGRAVSCLTALPPMLRLQGLLRHVGSQEGWQEAWDRACVLLASPVTPSLDLACLSTRASPRRGCSISAEDGLTPCLSPLRSHLSAGFLFCLLALYGSTLRRVLARSVRFGPLRALDGCVSLLVPLFAVPFDASRALPQSTSRKARARSPSSSTSGRMVRPAHGHWSPTLLCAASDLLSSSISRLPRGREPKPHHGRPRGLLLRP